MIQNVRQTMWLHNSYNLRESNYISITILCLLLLPVTVVNPSVCTVDGHLPDPLIPNSA